eukprot:SAG31_NODE_2031_length_6627_cov_1.575368_5_plen_201_part_00
MTESQDGGEDVASATTKRQRKTPLPPESWRWSPESVQFYELQAREMLDEILPVLRQPAFNIPYQFLRFRCWAGDDDTQKERVLRDATHRLRDSDQSERFGVNTPGSFADLYHDHRQDLSPRLAYRVWVELGCRSQYFKDDPTTFADVLPPSVQPLFDGHSDFFWQFLDCFQSLKEKLKAGQGFPSAMSASSWLCTSRLNP